MKIHRAPIYLLAIVTAVLHLACITPVRADDLDADANATALTTAPWKFTRKGESAIRIFAKDGTFTAVDKKEDAGQWIMTKDFVILIFPNGRKDALSLPLDPKGTDGYADNGDPLSAVRQNAPGTSAAPTAMVPPAQDTTAANNPPPAQAPAPTPEIPPPAPTPPPIPATAQQKAAALAQLISRPWRFVGRGWYELRIFHQDGTFTTQDNAEEYGKWVIAESTVNLVFPDGHIDTIALPLDPKSGHGMDKDGNTVAVIPGVPPPDTAVVQSSMDSFFHPAPTPHVFTPQEQAAAVATLTASPWRVTGRKWSYIRVFDKTGKFSTIGNEKEYGTWIVGAGRIEMTFADGHVDIIKLPLDPAGTDAADKTGAPAIAIQVTAEEVLAASQPPKPRVPKAATPPPYGTENQ